MGISYNTSLVRDGLVLHLDAANKKSYPGTGTTWTDMSGAGNNGTLVNGVGYSTTNKGTMTFDGVNDFVLSTNNANLQITTGTISTWFNANSNNTGFRGIITKQFAWGLFLSDNVLIAYDWGTGTYGTSRTTNINLGNNTWNNVTMSFSETIGSPNNNANIYLNSVLVTTTTIKHLNHDVSLQIGEANSNQNFSGSIASSSIYNRALTTLEIQKNFNTLRGRYGI